MEWIYPILGKQKSLPFYLSGVGIADPEYHVVRESGLISHQLLYTRSGAGSLVVDGVHYPQKTGSLFYLAPGIPHEYFPLVEDQWSTCWVVFRGEYLTELLRKMGLERFAYRQRKIPSWAMNAVPSWCTSICWRSGRHSWNRNSMETERKAVFLKKRYII